MFVSLIEARGPPDRAEVRHEGAPGISPVRLLALMRKEFIHIRRDPRSLAMAFLMPLILLVLFGYAHHHGHQERSTSWSTTRT